MNSDDTMYTFAERLRGFRTREDRKLTQQALADKLGASRRTISDWERGLYLPKTREMALDLAEALGLSPTDTNLLLVAAQYPPEPVAAGVEGGAARFEEAYVGRLVVDRLEASAPTPPAAIPTRVPESRARKLVGRADEIAWVCQQLGAGEVAAVVGVRGIGGIGKTEVAIAAVEALRSLFADQVIWLEGGANDVFALQGRLAEALGLRLEASELTTRGDALHLALRNGPPRLIVLDDLRRRHLADFAHLKPPCPPCALLVTSRRVDLPLAEEAILRLDQLEPAEARALLESLLPAGWLDREPGLAGDIASLLERIPLALTLAARRARQIGQRRDGGAETPLATLLAELQERRLQVLNQGEDPRRPDLSVVITFDASYGDLEPADQARLRRLGVFARNEFELAALQAVWGDDEGTARQAVQRLASAGLLEETGDDAWWMHDLLREYSEERLVRAGAEEDSTARLAYARYWHTWLHATNPASVDDWQALESNRPEIYRAADISMANMALDPTSAIGLCVEISRTFLPQGSPKLIEWLQTAALAAEQLAREANTDEAAADVYRSEAVLRSALGYVFLRQGRSTDALKYLQRSLIIHRHILDYLGMVKTLNHLSLVYSHHGQSARAETLVRDSIELCRSHGYMNLLAQSQTILGIIREQAHRPFEAAYAIEQALTHFSETQDYQGMISAEINLGRTHRRMIREGVTDDIYRVDNEIFRTAEIHLQNAIGLQKRLGESSDKHDRIEAHKELGCLYRDWVVAIVSKTLTPVPNLEGILTIGEDQLILATDLSCELQEATENAYVVQHIDLLHELAHFYYWRGKFGLSGGPWARSRSIDNPLMAMKQLIDLQFQYPLGPLVGDIEQNIIVGRVHFQYALLAQLEAIVGTECDSVQRIADHFGQAAAILEKCSECSTEFWEVCSNAYNWVRSLTPSQAREALIQLKATMQTHGFQDSVFTRTLSLVDSTS